MSDVKRSAGSPMVGGYLSNPDLKISFGTLFIYLSGRKFQKLGTCY